jgi:uncharacterized protein
MPQYLSPGVFVEEVPSSIKPIAGVGTSVAGFIGVIPVTNKNKPFFTPVKDESLGTGDGTTKSFVLKRYPVNDTGTTQPAGTLKNDPNTKTATFTFATAPKAGDAIKLSYEKLVTLNTPKLCTNFSEFIRNFSDLHSLGNKNNLAPAVYGFFNNGGTRCWVTGVMDDSISQIRPALDALGTIDEIALVAVPGVLDASVLDAVIDHCESQRDRFAILDGNPISNLTPKSIRSFLPPAATPNPSSETPPDNKPESAAATNPPADGDSTSSEVRESTYAAMYFPWIKVPDLSGDSTDTIDVPPSGHIAGIYARVDTERGVHKAPANEVIRGAVDVSKALSRAQQDGLNPEGINAIRKFNGSITVWGARTLGGDKNADLKYVNVRRLLIFLRKSIEQGTQFVVFEPNDPSLWAKITRNVTAFLTMVWRSGGLFGVTPQEAFYVKCDAETNPPELRDLGQVVTEIGVAVVKPAEFVIFRISQWAGPGGTS